LYPRLLSLSVDGKLACVLRALSEAAAHWLARTPSEVLFADDDDDDDSLDTEAETEEEEEGVGEDELKVDIAADQKADMRRVSGTGSASSRSSAASTNVITDDVEVEAEIEAEEEKEKEDDGLDGDEELVRDVLKVLERDLDTQAAQSQIPQAQTQATKIRKTQAPATTDMSTSDTTSMPSTASPSDGTMPSHEGDIDENIDDLIEDEDDAPAAADALIAEHALARRRDPVRTMVSSLVSYLGGDSVNE
jgi:hypothetical protein